MRETLGIAQRTERNEDLQNWNAVHKILTASTNDNVSATTRRLRNNARVSVSVTVNGDSQTVSVCAKLTHDGWLSILS